MHYYQKKVTRGQADKSVMSILNSFKRWFNRLKIRGAKCHDALENKEKAAICNTEMFEVLRDQ